MNTEGSGLFPYGLGIVAVTKEDNVDTVMFFPAEKLSLEYGKVDEIKDEIEVEVLDINNKKHKIKAERGAMMEARWFPDGSDGRQTAPDVVNGETIQIYRFRDSDVFYWKTILREPELRRLEHVVYAYSNLPSGRSKFELDSSYGHSWSTKDKKVTFWTSQSNGEAFSYKFKIDTAASTWSMWDNVSNGFGIESIIGQVYMRTTTGGFFEITRNLGTMSLTEGLEVETPRAVFSNDVFILNRLAVTSFILGGFSTSISSVPSSPVSPGSRVYKQNYAGYELYTGTGVIIGDDCLFEMGHQAQIELGRNSHLTMQENSKVELDFGSLIKLGEDSTVALEQRATVTVGNESSTTLGDENIVKIGDGAIITVGNESSITIDQGATVTVGNESSTTLGDENIVKIGDRANITVGNESSTTLGDENIVKIGERANITVGPDSTVALDQKATVTVGNESSTTLGDENIVQIGERANITVGPDSDIEIKEASRVNVKTRTIITLEDDVELWVGGRNIMSLLRDLT